MASHPLNSVHMLVGSVLSLMFVVTACTQTPTTAEGPDQSPAPPEVAAPSHPDQIGRRTRQSNRSPWWMDEENVQAVAVTDEQLEQLKEMKKRLGSRIFRQRQLERKAYLRLVRMLGQDPNDPILIEKLGQQYEKAMLEKHRINVERLQETRVILGVDQWNKLIEVDPSAVQIGGFRLTPPILITITDGTPIPVTPTPGGNQ